MSTLYRTAVKTREKSKRNKNVRTLENEITREVVNANSFLSGAFDELQLLDRFVTNSISRMILDSLFYAENIESATNVARDFAKSIAENQKDYLNDENVKAFFSSTPIFKILFLTNDSSNKLQNQIRDFIFKDNSREQFILYSMMNICYSDSSASIEDTVRIINEDLENDGFARLDGVNSFDGMIFDWLLYEEAINRKYNVNSTISGLRRLSILIR